MPEEIKDPLTPEETPQQTEDKLVASRTLEKIIRKAVRAEMDHAPMQNPMRPLQLESIAQGSAPQSPAYAISPANPYPTDDTNRTPVKRPSHTFENPYQFAEWIVDPAQGAVFQKLPELTNFLCKELVIANLTDDDIAEVKVLSSVISDACAMGDTSTAERYQWDLLTILLLSRSRKGKQLGLLSTVKQIVENRVARSEEDEEEQRKKKGFFGRRD